MAKRQIKKAARVVKRPARKMNPGKLAAETMVAALSESQIRALIDRELQKAVRDAVGSLVTYGLAQSLRERLYQRVQGLIRDGSYNDQLTAAAETIIERALVKLTKDD